MFNLFIGAVAGLVIGVLSTPAYNLTKSVIAKIKAKV